MQWNKESDNPLPSWLDMQEKMFKGWWDVMVPQSNGHTDTSPNARWQLWVTQGLEQWQALAQENFAAVSQQLMADATKHAMSQFLIGQGQAQYLLRMVTEAWQSMLTNAASPAEWQSAMVAYTDQLRQQMALAMDSTKRLQNSTELWRLYYTEAQKLAQPWLNAWWQTPVFMSKLGGTEQATATTEFMQLFHAAFEQTIGRTLMAPSLGLSRDFNEQVSKSFELWLENQQTQATYQLLLGEAWLDAFQALMQKLVDMAQKGETITDQRHLLRIWVEVADTVFIELFHSEAYATAQSAYVNSNMAVRRQQRELLEVGLRNHDLPTRTDVDEAHHQIYQLRKEVKALKKSMGAHEARLASAELPAKTKAAPRTTSKKRASAAASAEPATKRDEQPQEGAA